MDAIGNDRRVVLAYSGGLDTAVILHWLVAQGYDVVTYTANLGQPEDFERLRRDALATGASEAYVDDVRDEFLTDFVAPLLRANALYEDRYLLGTPAARPLTARRQVEVATDVGATHVAHGATGIGNDQVRFELLYRALRPDLTVVAVWRDPDFLATFDGRPAALAYAAEHNIPVKPSTDAPWSVDENLMHTSYEGGDLEGLDRRPREEMYQRTVSPTDAPDEETVLELTYHEGDLVSVRIHTDGTRADDPLEAFCLLDRIASANGVGRVDFVEDRTFGVKSRNVYEAPAATVLHVVHRELEHLTMDPEVMRLRDALVPQFSTLVYRGLWYSPEASVLRTMFDATQKHVSGTVEVALYKGNVTIVSRTSAAALYDAREASLEAIASNAPSDAAGFIALTALRLRLSAEREERQAAATP